MRFNSIQFFIYAINNSTTNFNKQEVWIISRWTHREKTSRMIRKLASKTSSKYKWYNNSCMQTKVNYSRKLKKHEWNSKNRQKPNNEYKRSEHTKTMKYSKFPDKKKLFQLFKSTFQKQSKFMHFEQMNF